MNRFRPALPDFNTSYTHSCNNLASYEVKKNPEPKMLTAPSAGADLDRTGSTVLDFV